MRAHLANPDSLEVSISIVSRALIEEAAARRGAQVPWLSPYSPGFGPVEHRRSKGENYLRGAGARTVNELDKTLARAIGLVTGADTRSLSAHRGYPPARECKPL